MKRNNIKEMENVEITTGSIYEVLKHKDHAEMATKANLVMGINSAIKRKRLTQAKAAELFGITQPKLSDLLRGHFRGYSVQRLMDFLTALGKDVNIVITDKPRNRKARVSVHQVNELSKIVPAMATKRRS